MKKNYSDRARIAWGAVSGIIFNFINIGVSLIMFRLLYQYLSKEHIGTWVIFLSIAAFINFLDFGISPTLSREIGFIKGANNLTENEKISKVLNLLVYFTKAFFYLACIVLVSGAMIFLLAVFNNASEYEIRVAWIIFIIGSAVCLWGNSKAAGLFGLGNVAIERSIRAFSLIIYFVFGYLFLSKGFGIIGLSIAWLLQHVTSRGVASYLLNRKISLNKKHYFNRAEIQTRSLLSASVKYSVVTLSAFLIFKTDSIIIATLFGANQVPDYEAIVRIIMALMSLGYLMMSSSSPFYSRYHKSFEYKKIIKTLFTNLRLILGIIGIPVLFLSLYGEQVITLWIGKEHFLGYPVILLLLFTLILEVHHVIHATCLMAVGQLVFHWVGLFAGILNIVATIIFAKEFGIIGVALGTVLAQLLTNNWYAPYRSLKYFNIKPTTYLKEVFKPVLSVYILILSTGVLLKFLVFKAVSPFTIFCEVSFMAGVGVIAIYFCCLNNGEQAFIKEFLKINIKLKKC